MWPKWFPNKLFRLENWVPKGSRRGHLAPDSFQMDDFTEGIFCLEIHARVHVVRNWGQLFRERPGASLWFHMIRKCVIFLRNYARSIDLRIVQILVNFIVFYSEINTTQNFYTFFEIVCFIGGPRGGFGILPERGGDPVPHIIWIDEIKFNKIYWKFKILII